MDTRADTDRIERSILINASRERVWRAISNAEEFGAWFGADLSGQVFKPGERTRGPMPMDGCVHNFEILIDRIEPQNTLSFKWHPYAVEPGVDYSSEEATLVTFTLADAPDNAILLTVVETGFDKVPQHRRAKAFEMHQGGWEAQLRNVARHVGN
ncbi:SRPBCC family protein [Oxalobacteraceae bacterium]|nr:SRPBCC family protein [Oxalobacteraceae bacterium]